VSGSAVTRHLSDLGGATAFLTTLGRGATPTPQTLRWFPLVGILVGGTVGAVWWAAASWWPPLLAALLVVVADLVITGALHHDGVADSADGLLPHLDRERRLEVMRAPDVGTFAVVTLVAVIGLQVAALATIEPDPLLLAGIWCASRTAMVVVASTQPYARSEGLASAFLGGSGAGGVALVGAGLAIGLVWWSGWLAIVALGSLALTAVAVTWLARRRIGGFTGDVLGALCVLGQTTALLTVAASW
jgi:adenosylcobinamide-GDP ribazoletransferase